MRLKVGEVVEIVVEAEYEEPTVYEISTPAYAQDDGLGGCLVIRVTRPHGLDDEALKVLAHWGSNEELPDWGDAPDAGDVDSEIPTAKSVIVGPEHP